MTIILFNSYRCVECISPQYLILMQNSPGVCLSCPSDAICLGGSNIGPNPGYWRKNNITTSFIKCPYPAACLGMIGPDYVKTGQCDTQY